MYTLKRLKKMGFLLIVILIQLSLSLAIINNSSNLLLANHNKKKGLESLFNASKSYLVRLVPIDGFDNIDENFHYFDSFIVANDNYHIFSNLKKSNLIKNDFIYYPSIMPIKEINFKNVPEKLQNLSEMNQADALSKILVCDNFLNRNTIKVSKGRTLTAEDTKKDYKKDNIPILLGSDFKDIYKIGDKIKASNWATIDYSDNIMFEVVGIMENYAIPATRNYGDAFASSVLLGNAFTVIPTVDNFLSLSHGAAIGDSGVILEINDNTSISYIKNYLNEEFNKLGFKVDIADLGMLSNAALNLTRDYKSSLFLGVVLCLLSMLGTMCILLGIIKQRQREFAIKLINGATINNIIDEFKKEVRAICILASIISISISIGKIPSLLIISINIGLILLIAMLISILPIRHLKKLKLIELLKEE
ncbi:MAG: FtsX-like permease family protein [Sarcina sp.]